MSYIHGNIFDHNIINVCVHSNFLQKTLCELANVLYFHTGPALTTTSDSAKIHVHVHVRAMLTFPNKSMLKNDTRS